MREITSHKVNPVNDRLKLFAVDAPNPQSFANHRYMVRIPTTDTNATIVEFNFQDGPIESAGVNGVTHEVLIAVILDRLKGFQEGPYKCRENALAITKLEEAKLWLFSRTIERMQRGVEGTHAI